MWVCTIVKISVVDPDPDPAALKLIKKCKFFYFFKLLANIFIFFEGVSSLTKEDMKQTRKIFKKFVMS